MEIVTRFLDTIISNLDRYWDEPRSYAGALERGESDPGSQETLGLLHPDVRWVDALGGVREGRLAFAQGADELLQLQTSYSLAIVEVTDLGGDQVLATLRVSMKGIRSEAAAGMLLHVLIAVRDGLLADYVEYTTRTEALKAAGLAE